MKTLHTRAVFCLAALAVVSTASARLGESPGELKARFDAPIRNAPFHASGHTFDRRIYYRPGWLVLVTYWKGHSAHEQYYRLAEAMGRGFEEEWFSVDLSFFERERPTTFLRNIARHAEGIGNRDIRTILQANANGQQWYQRKPQSLEFLRADRAAFARYLRRNDDGESMIVVTTDFERLLNAGLGSGDPIERARTTRVGTF